MSDEALADLGGAQRLVRERDHAVRQLVAEQEGGAELAALYEARREKVRA